MSGGFHRTKGVPLFFSPGVKFPLKKFGKKNQVVDIFIIWP